MDERSRIAWLYRRVGFGLAAGELDRLVADGYDLVLDRLLDPAAHGVPEVEGPFEHAPLSDDALEALTTGHRKLGLSGRG